MSVVALSLPETLRLHGRYLADMPAISGEVEVTYGDLNQLVTGVAAWAHERSLPGRRVALMLPPNASHLVIMLGLLRAGAVVCPVNTRLTARDVEHYLAVLDPSLLVADRVVGSVSTFVVDADSGLPIDGIVPLVEREADQGPTPSEHTPAIVFPTGGTTGSPKAALWTQRSLALAVQSSMQHLEVRRAERELYFSPFFHLTLVTGLFTTMLAGGTVHLLGHFDEEQAAEALSRVEFTRMFGTPAALERLSNHAPPEGWPSMRSVVFGASRSWPDLPARLTAVFPRARLITGYGATEFGAVTRQYHDDIIAGVGGVGRPVASVEIRCVDDSGNEVARGEIGELLVRSPWQMDGYLGEADQPIDVHGFVRSGDLGRIEPDGCIVLVDRRRDLIKSGGETVYPRDVEQALLGLPDVAEAAAFGRLDRLRGETVEAAIVAQVGCTPDPVAIREALVGLLTSYQVPARIHLVGAIPLTSNFKVDRRRLIEELT